MQNQENPIVWNELEKEIIRYTTRYSSDSRFSSGSIAALIDIIIDSSNEYIENLDGILKLFMTNTNRTIHPEDIKRFVYASNQAIINTIRKIENERTLKKS